MYDMNKIIVIILSLFSQILMAQVKWSIVGESQMSQKQQDELRSLEKKYPMLDSDAALNKLMKDISSITSYNRVEAFYTNGLVTIRLDPAQIFKEFSIKAITYDISSALEPILIPFQGQINSAETRSRMKEAIVKDLKNKGYFKPKLKLNIVNLDYSHIKVNILINEGYPCLISKVETTFAIPKNVEIAIEKNDYCDIKFVEAALKDFESDLTEAGFNQFKIDKPEFIFNEKENTAILKLSGSIGKKVISKVVSPLSNPALVGIVFGDDLHTLDNTITDPNTMRTEILRKFRDLGYHDVKITESFVSYPEEDEILYTFFVDPGPQYVISEVQLEGIVSIDHDEALQSMDLFSVINTSPLLTDKIVSDAVDSLSNYYAERGFWDAKVYYPKITKNKQSQKARLVFNIKEGRKRVFNNLVIRGNKAFSEDEIREHINVERDQDLAWKTIIDFQQKIKEMYRQQGYLYTKVKLDLIHSTHFREVRTTLSLILEEGIRAKFGVISVAGLRRTQEIVVRRELTIEEGDWYSPEALDDTRQALIDLGIFSLVTISPSVSTDFIEEKPVIPYTVHIKESRPGQVNFGPGWSLQDGGRFTLDASYNNIQGIGRQVFFSGSYTEEINQDPIGNNNLLGYNLGIGYVEPYLLDLPVNGILTYNQYADALEQQRELSRSVKSTLTRSFRFQRDRYSLGLFALYKITQEEAEQDVEILLNSDEIQIREFGVTGNWDSRNNNSWPTKGGILLLEASRAALIFGADTEYWHWSATLNRFYSINPIFVLAASINLESYTNVVRTDSNLLPSSERIKSGGAESNRGYKRNSLGPIVRYVNADGVEQTINIGGTNSASLKLEVRQLLSSSFGLTYFLDASNTYVTGKEAADFNSRFADSPDSEASLEDNFDYDFFEYLQRPQTIWEQNYISYGLALNYITPFGTVNASYGFPLSRCPSGKQCYESRGNQNYRTWWGGQVHFNVGTNF